MISRLSVQNLKALREASLELRPLTVLTGPNSSGKSTLIQSLLLAHSAQESTRADVPVNGGRFGLEMGEAAELLSHDAQDNRIVIEVTGESTTLAWTFTVEEDRSTALRIATRPSTELGLPSTTYLSAERLGPRDLQEVPSRSAEFHDVGCRGQFSAHVLATTERQQVRPGLLHRGTATANAPVTLGGQVGLWLSDVVGPVSVSATWLSGTNAATVRFRPPGPTSTWLRPANVGFGFSYALPIVVAGLSMPEGSLLLVENPEAHLHPAGQSAMGRFLASLPPAGIQCVVETHSDHVLNGIRRAAAEGGIIEPEDAVVYFLGETGARAIRVAPTGALSEWPRGFFDQITSDLAELSRIRVQSP